MEPGTEPIRQDIDAIRESMTDKMEQIESRVKGTVEQTVQTVKQTFDLRAQVTERPWVAMGLAVAAGFALGSIGGDRQEPAYPAQRGEAMRYYPDPIHQYGDEKAQEHAPAAGQMHSQSGFVADMTDQFGDELQTIKTAAISAAMAMLRDFVKQNLPQFSQEYERMQQEREPQEARTWPQEEAMRGASPLQERGVGDEVQKHSSYMYQSVDR